LPLDLELDFIDAVLEAVESLAVAGALEAGLLDGGDDPVRGQLEEKTRLFRAPHARRHGFSSVELFICFSIRSAGVSSFLSRLQPEQAGTTLPGLLSPPRASGTI